MYIPLRLLNLGLHLTEKPAFRRAKDPIKFRKRFENQAKRLFIDPPLTAYLPDNLHHENHKVPALWAINKTPTQDGVILYFHGGGYAIGSPNTHRAMLARLSQLTGLRTLLPDYGLAPEAPFPAAITDAKAAYLALLNRGYRPNQIVLGGDSAGGGLMLALLHTICTENLPRPGAAFAFSPWTDLTLSGESLKTNAKAEAILPAEKFPNQVAAYLNGADANDPQASPLFGTFTDAPPTLIQVGDTEILLDDSRRMAENLTAQGVETTLEIWPNTPHVWPIFQGQLRQADQALTKVAAFIKAAL